MDLEELKKKKKLTSDEQAWVDEQVKKHVRRIKRFIKSAENRGYTFPTNAIPKLPKKNTPLTVERLNKIRPSTLYKKAVYTSPEGTKIKGYKQRAKERSEASKKGHETRKKFAEQRAATAYAETAPPKLQESKLVMNNMRSFISSLDDVKFVMDNRDIKSEWYRDKVNPLGNYKEADFNQLKSVLDYAIRTYGEEEVSKRIQENATTIADLLTSILYDSGDKYHRTGRDGMNAKIQMIATILKGSPLSSSESMQITSMGERLGVYE